eukprot:1144255-Pelagomonas_calceolata.AAC.2
MGGMHTRCKVIPTLAGLLNVLANGLRDELGHQVLEVHAAGLAVHDVSHLLADSADLGALGVGGALDLALPLLGEGNAEQAQHEAVGGAHIHVRLNQRLPLAHQGAQLVRGEVHALRRKRVHRADCVRPATSRIPGDNWHAQGQGDIVHVVVAPTNMMVQIPEKGGGFPFVCYRAHSVHASKHSPRSWSGSCVPAHPPPSA